MTKKDKFANVDLRKLPRDKRPKPTTGQSAEARELPWDHLSKDEKAVVRLLNGKDRARTPRSIEWLAEGVPGDNPRLQTRNALRRLVSCGWADKAERAVYVISERGRRRMQALAAKAA